MTTKKKKKKKNDPEGEIVLQGSWLVVDERYQALDLENSEIKVLYISKSHHAFDTGV